MAGDLGVLGAGQELIIVVVYSFSSFKRGREASEVCSGNVSKSGEEKAAIHFKPVTNIKLVAPPPARRATILRYPESPIVTC